MLGYRPRTTSLAPGCEKLVRWLDGRVAIDRVGEARAALASRGLTLMTVAVADPGGRAARRPVLITGGAGFIGTNLADRLLRQGRPRAASYDSLARPGSEANLRWLCAQHGARLQVEIADLRDGARLRDAPWPKSARCFIWPRRSR